MKKSAYDNYQKKLRRYFHANRRRQVGAALLLVLFITSTIIATVQPYMTEQPYQLNDAAREVLPEANPKFAELLKYDAKKSVYDYNAGYTAGMTSDTAMSASGTPRINASFNTDPAKGLSVTDPVNQINVTLKPEYGLGLGKQEGNQVFYPMTKARGYLAYTAQVSGVKEDILLSSYSDDEMTFGYELDIESGLEARLEANGSIAIYGTDLPLNGAISTGSDQDVKLLEKARTNARKTKLLFTIPAPVVVETNKTVSQVKAHFELDGKKLKVVAKNLKDASYPLSIDPSVYVETAQKLMRGNNETNLDFDVTNELIQKGKLTGARFNSWTSGLALPAARWNHATAVAGGYIYVVGGSSGSSNVATIYWAKFNTTTGAIESPNPGNGACSNWCTASAYDLLDARAGHSLVAYNGFLYVMGGLTSAGARSNTVSIAKIGANGEPSLWHPTDTNKNNWVYWYTAGNLSTERSYTAAVAYDNRMYLVGGQTNAATGGVTTVEVANINPTGDLGSWSTTGMTVLPAARHGHSIQVYNDRIYVIGGNNAGTLQATVYYIKLTSSGTMASSWVSTTAFGTARSAWGGNISTIWGGYLYVAGGCSAVNGSGYCTTIRDDIQLASINADGSVTDWTTIASVTSSRMGYGLVAWRNNIYGIAGCTAHNTSTGACTTTATATNYGSINPDGDASTVSNSVASGTAPCSGANPYDCDIPPVGDAAGQGGRMSNGVVINNGFIYIIGGCTDISTTEECYNAASAMTGNISYAALAVDGTLVKPATCGGTSSGSWCVDNTNRVNGTAGLGTMATAVFNNVIYVIGGTDGDNWSANVYRVGLNNDGSLTGAWTAQTFTNLALGTARGYSFAFTRANAASATLPGFMYVIGGCNNGTTSNGLGCGTYYSEVYRCPILASGALDETNATDCTTAGQQQLDAEPGTTGTQGLGLMAGVVYANFIYLVGGSSDNEAERGEVMYARINANHNIVAVSGSIWQTSANQMDPIRRRGFAFGYNGYLYSLAGYNPTDALLNDLLLAKIDVSDGSIGAFVTSGVTVTARWDLKAVVANGYVYAFGGCTAGAAPAGCTAMTGSIQTFQLYNNYSGSPAVYSASANLFTTDRIGASSAVLNGYIYVAGGCTSATDCTTATDNVMFAALNPDGTIGTWANTTDSTLPAVRAFGQMEVVGGTLYYIGGQSSTATDERAEVYYGTPSSGNVSAWNTATNGLPAARTQHSSAVWNGRIYVVGGLDASAAASNVVYASPSLSAGGNIASAWTATGMTVLDTARSGHTTIAYAGNLYVLGGFDGTNYLNDVSYTQIDASGTLNNWLYTTSLPQKIRQADGYAANGFLYLFGGRSASATCSNNTYVAAVSANTTIASGNTPTGVGEWYQTNVEYTTDRYGAAVVHNEGRAYVLGGGCGATLTYTGANRIVSSVMQSQPQIAKYSRMIDTDTDVFPTKWLMNGLDNDIGARWQMNYRSSTNTTAAWGQSTSFGTVTLGSPQTYIPKDSGGTNTNFARYYYMSVNIDSSQAFGYPEDVTRGPTIADLSLFFTSDPSKRLKHGATFTGGQLQPLDTPFP